MNKEKYNYEELPEQSSSFFVAEHPKKLPVAGVLSAALYMRKRCGRFFSDFGRKV